MSFQGCHIPVLFEQVIKNLNLNLGDYVLDGTLGMGGHAKGILDKIKPDGRLVAFDLDSDSIELAMKNLTKYEDMLTVINDNYRNAKVYAEKNNWPKFNSILLDLGLSSYQMFDKARGFSFSLDAPLDMRFNKSNPISAYNVVNDFSEKEIADIIYKYGDEHRSRKIAGAIIKARNIKKIENSSELGKIVSSVIKYSPSKKINPATKTFMAIRIFVNNEMESLSIFLNSVHELLKPGGILAIITFHSTEDRIVKEFIKNTESGKFTPIFKKPLIPDENEIRNNPRARSAKLRLARLVA